MSECTTCDGSGTVPKEPGGMDWPCPECSPRQTSEPSVFIVTADTDYEGSDVLFAFRTMSEAEAFAEECRAYDRKEPEYPSIVAPDSEWESHNEAAREWREGHPAGRSHFSDHYTAREVKFRKP